MKTFKSKVDSWLVAVVFLVLAIVAIPMITPQILWAGVIVIFIVALFFIDMIINTKYTIDGNMLKVQYGSLYKRDYDIGGMTEIRPTKTMQSSPALSLDRMEIRVGKYDRLVISPTDKELFVEELQRINPDILYKR